MLVAGGGGGYGGTYWTAKEVPAMWAAIANQETEPHYEVVGGWSKTAELTLAHLAQVQMYRDNLASVWPPSKSPAAAAYIARLDKLMVDLQATHDAASANYTAFSTVTLTLSLARKKVEALYQKYESNAKQNFVWQQKKEAAAASSTPTPSPSPSGARDVPPVSNAQQEELNRQAREIMFDLSNTILSGHAALQKPKPYSPDQYGRGDEDKGQGTGSGAGGFATPPIIPPPGGGGGGSGLSGGSISPGSSSSPPIAPVSPVTHAPGSSLPSTGGGGAGPILGGIGNPPVIAPPTPTPPPPGPTPVPPQPGLGPVPGIIGTPSASGLLPPGGLPPGGLRTPQSGLVKPGTPAGGRMTMPSGGVIGANPGSGMIGQMPAGTGGRPPGAGRVNPVGGVIGQQGGARGAASAHGLPLQNAPMAGGQGRARGRRQEGEQERWDPDNPWSTDEGVDPVVLPPDDGGPIDPGPAIGYSR